MNQMKTRLQALGLVDRALAATSDAEIDALVAGLGEDHIEALGKLCGGAATRADDAEGNGADGNGADGNGAGGTGAGGTGAGGISADEIRAGASKGRLDGTMESIVMVLTDACLADCIEQLGDHADSPSSDQLREVLPGLTERHGVPVTRLMLASTVAGEAPASAIIRDLLKHDELVKLPPAEAKPLVPMRETPRADDAEREALREKRREMKARRQAEARARREQSKRDRGKV